MLAVVLIARGDEAGLLFLACGLGVFALTGLRVDWQRPVPESDSGRKFLSSRLPITMIGKLLGTLSTMLLIGYFLLVLWR